MSLDCDTNKMYHVTCCDDDKQIWKFTYKTLINHPSSKLTEMLFKRGPGGGSGVITLDYDPDLFNLIVKELKYPGSVDWRLSYNDLTCVKQYCLELGLYSLSIRIDRFLNEKKTLRSLMTKVMKSGVVKLRKSAILSDDEDEVLCDYLFSLTQWYHPEDEEDLYTQNLHHHPPHTEGDDEEEDDGCNDPECKNCHQQQRGNSNNNIINGEDKKEGKEEKGQDNVDKVDKVDKEESKVEGESKLKLTINTSGEMMNTRNKKRKDKK